MHGCVSVDRESSGAMPYVISEITKGRYQQGGRALVE
jgi:hypothetical protein